MSWMQHVLKSAVRHHQSSSNFCRRAACATWAASAAAPARHSAPSSSSAASVAAAAMPRMAAAARSLHSMNSSSCSMPFAARYSAPSFAASPLTAVSTGGSRGGAGAAGAGGGAGTGLESLGEDDEDTLEPRSKRLKKPPDTGGYIEAEDTIEGTSPDDGEQILFLSRTQRLQRPLSREAAARLHYLVQVRESQSGLPRVRVGREGLKKAFLATVGDYLQDHGAVKVNVPKNSGVEPGFVAFCLESSQDCVVLGRKGNTLTVYRDTSLPRPPSTYADTDLALASPRSHSHTPAAVHSHSHSPAHQQLVLQQLSQQVEFEDQPTINPIQPPWTHDASTLHRHSAAQHEGQELEEVGLPSQQQGVGAAPQSGMKAPVQKQQHGGGMLGAAGGGEPNEEWLGPMPGFKQLDAEDEGDGMGQQVGRDPLPTGHTQGSVRTQGGGSGGRDSKKGAASGKVSSQEGGPAKRLKLRLGRVVV